MSSLIEFVLQEEGQDLIEYALLAAFISMAVVTAVTNVGTALGTTYESFSDDIASWTP